MPTSFLLGAAIGLVAVMTPGPVSVTIVDIGASRGRTSGLHAGLGVAGGDSIASAAALGLVIAGTSLPTVFFTATQLLSALVLVVVGAGLVSRPDIGHELVGRVQRPFRSMLALTALTPSVFGAWIALFNAMPFADDPIQLAWFALGGLVASFGWHLALGGAAGSMARLVTPRRRAGLARLGGFSMFAVAGWSVA